MSLKPAAPLSERDLLVRAFRSFEMDRIEILNGELAGATHLVATRRGLFAISREAWQHIAHGFFFGITLRGSDIYVFEACDNPNSQLKRGRIVKFTRQGHRITAARVLAKGLDSGCHQIDFLGDRLHVIDTYNQRVLRFHADERSYETLTPLPTTQELWEKHDLRYGHVNSILAVGDRILLLLHNVSQYTGRTSEVAVYTQNWAPLGRWKLKGRSCHGLATLEDGTLLTCDTMSGDLISAQGLRVRVSPFITRGLAVGADSIVVGGSKKAEREDRLLSPGTVTFLDRNYAIESVLELPGAPTEIRRLDGQDSGLSNYLQQVPWGRNLKEGTQV